MPLPRPSLRPFRRGAARRRRSPAGYSEVEWVMREWVEWMEDDEDPDTCYGGW